jgi:hypothetical protein
MITEIDNEFADKFQRIYPVAETYGFSMSDIEKLISVLKDDIYCMNLYSNEKHLQTVLRMILVRLNLQRDEFLKHIHNKWDIQFWRQVDFEYAVSEVGRYSLPAYVTLIENVEKLK